MPFPLINTESFAPPHPLFSIIQYFKDSIPYNLQLEGFKLFKAGRNYVTLDKVNWTSRVCVALKKIWSYCTLTSLGKQMFSSIQWNFNSLTVYREHLVIFSYVFGICFKGESKPHINFKN